MRVANQEPKNKTTGPAGHVHPWWLTVVLALANGMLLVLAFEVPALWAAALLIPVPLVWLALGCSSGRRAVLITLGVQLLTWLWLGRWVISVTWVGYPLMALYIGAYGTVFVGLIRYVGRRYPGRILPMALLVPVIWVGLECVRGEIVFYGYAWFFLAHPLVEWTTFAQSADLFGVYFVSFLAAAVAGALVDLSRRQGRAAGIVVLALLAANLVYGIVRQRETARSTDGPRVLVIQTNLPQDNKMGWTRQQQARDLPHFIDMTRAAVQSASAPIDLIVWPETMLPGVGLESDTLETVAQFGQDTEYLYEWGLAVVELSRQLRIPMLVGSPVWLDVEAVVVGDRYRLERDVEYNAAYLVQGTPPFQRYDKVLLTPFGETLPYLSAWPALEQRLMAIGAHGMSFALDASPRIERLTLQHGNGTTIATPICFEDTVSRVCRRMIYEDGMKQTQALINLSNDGWFGNHDAGRRQHAQIARYRCIENRVPMIRAVNTGMSMLIDSGGNVREVIGGGRYGSGRIEGQMDVSLPLDARHTLYGRIGDIWAWACLAGTVGLIVWALVAGPRGSTE